ncbi:hypothetical protein VNO78_22038 [Psophocarpus tetragonolobus]|uniref:Uncharacterized protein n=1 Tax=Psophocarpus tetragonolobus TaxID=3891 RepID=A0AAN9SD46_PSOTE
MNKKESNKNSKCKQVEATPIFQPQHCIGLYVCKEHNGTRTLGTVLSYDTEKKLFEVWYDDEKTEYKEPDEVLKSKATAKDIFDARAMLKSSNNAKKIANKEKQKATSNEEE